MVLNYCERPPPPPTPPPPLTHPCYVAHEAYCFILKWWCVWTGPTFHRHGLHQTWNVSFPGWPPASCGKPVLHRTRGESTRLVRAAGYFASCSWATPCEMDHRQVALCHYRMSKYSYVIIILGEICRAPALRLKALSRYNTHNVHRDGKCYQQFNRKLTHHVDISIM